jgi:hypothetical protein
MEIKVRLLDGAEPKGIQEVENELLEKHEQSLESNGDNFESGNGSITQEPAPSEFNFKDEDVLSYIGKRYNKQINSFDELMEQRQVNEELPEDVAAYLNYKKDTGRGFEDFLKLRKDYDSMDQNQLLRDYLADTQQNLDEEDIEVLMEDYTYDEDLDEESKIKHVKIARKKAIAEAKKYFNSQKEKYKLPLESSGIGLSPEEKEEFEAYRQYTKQSKTVQEESDRKRKWFDQKTDEVFSKDFKGFEFDINDKKISFAPASASELKSVQSSPLNFVNKFLDDSGLIKDAAGYHRSLSIAMNPEKFAKFFYEQGMSDATDDVTRKIKNINMTERRAPEASSSTGGMQVRAVNPDSGRNLKIRSIKKM